VVLGLHQDDAGGVGDRVGARQGLAAGQLGRQVVRDGAFALAGVALQEGDGPKRDAVRPEPADGGRGNVGKRDESPFGCHVCLGQGRSPRSPNTTAGDLGELATITGSFLSTSPSMPSTDPGLQLMAVVLRRLRNLPWTRLLLRWYNQVASYSFIYYKASE